ncbi:MULTISPECIES: hypothetical protein [unclassified Gluconobacter]|uniref:hypothetical protein n=1 Tax=unclassified Gluconobacter TaxID=2644261 RepID=UPI00188BE405|nr:MULTISPECIES: hypothetical protein [unclassified Gluconobacter]
MSTETTNNPTEITLLRIREWGACGNGRDWFREKFPQGGDYGLVMNALYDDKRFGDAQWLASKVFAEIKDTAAIVGSEVNAIQSVTKDKDESGNDAQIGSSGNYARIGSSGYGAKIGSSGYGAKIGSSGDDAQIGSSGDCARIGSSGDCARIGSSGNYARIGSSGNYAQIGSSGDCARIGSSGDCARIGSSGNYAQIGSSGDCARIGSSGDCARIKCEGENAVVASAGQCTQVILGENGCASLVWHDGERSRFTHLYEGEDGVEAGVAYRLDDAGKVVRA